MFCCRCDSGGSRLILHEAFEVFGYSSVGSDFQCTLHEVFSQKVILQSKIAIEEKKIFWLVVGRWQCWGSLSYDMKSKKYSWRQAFDAGVELERQLEYESEESAGIIKCKVNSVSLIKIAFFRWPPSKWYRIAFYNWNLSRCFE